MGSRKNGQVPRRVAWAAARFAAWRRTHEPHTRIPNFLWNAAVKLASEFGVSYTATRLRLNYNDLKKHVAAAASQATHPSAAEHSPAFVELPAAALPLLGECLIELENSAGAKMRIQIKGSRCPDLVALSTAFCQVEP